MPLENELPGGAFATTSDQVGAQPQRRLSITENELLASLRLFRSERIGPRTYKALLQAFGSAEAALEALPNMGKKIRICSVGEAEKELKAVEKFGAQMLLKGAEGYPEALAVIEDAPPLITVKGRLELLGKSTIGVVGARNASLAGTRLAGVIAKGLGVAGCIVASGLARGIDTAAHNATIDTGTIAVIAGGIDSIYPPENKALQQRLYEEGLVVAELPFGASPKAEHFPQRNRIISGLSQGVLVVEASLRSGSLITARLALEQGREVFAVPGSPLDPRAEGPNRLIKQGAILVESAQDILEHIRAPRTMPLFRGVSEDAAPVYALEQKPVRPADEIEQALLQALSSAPTPMDQLLAQFSGEEKALHLTLLQLELGGRIERQPGNCFVLA